MSDTDERPGTSGRRTGCQGSVEGSECGRTISKEEAFDLLRNERRRIALEYLRSEGKTATMGELAEHVAAAENGTDTDRLSSQQRKRAYVSLHQNHLPKMDEVGVVAYDKDRGTVSLCPGDPVAEHLSASTPSDGVGHLYVALAVAAVAVVGLVGLGPTAAVPAAVWGLVSTAALLAVVAVELRRRADG